MKRKLAALLPVLLAPGMALAQLNPNWTDTRRSDPWSLTGSDTLSDLMFDLLFLLDPQLEGGILRYDGRDSVAAQRDLEGDDFRFCAPGDSTDEGELSPGCQEVAPMTVPLNSGICDDDLDDLWAQQNTRAEGFAFCSDALVVVGNNDSIGAFGDSQAACSVYFSSPETSNLGPGYPVGTFPDRGVGRLRASGNIGGYTIADWRDVLRLVYTGCKNSDGACVPAIPRLTRCSDPVRRQLVADWGKLFEGVPCAQSAGCPGGLRHAYRTNDTSGTALLLLQLLGVSAGSSLLPSRPAVVTADGRFLEVPRNHPFCDGGDQEGLLPTGGVPGGAPTFAGGDPIRTNCAPEDDLCALDGRLGLVRAVASREGVANALPTHQCERSFAYAPYLSTALPVCPGNTKPSAGRCLFPVFKEGSFRTFNCAASSRQCPASAPAGTDCRNFNALVHDPMTGAVAFVAARRPLVASWRQNFARLNNSPTFTNGKEFVWAADEVCAQQDATRTIGCLTANSRCTLGVAGRDAAFTTSNDVHLLNEPARVNGIAPSDAAILAGSYPMPRYLWVNATRGFENIMEDCKNRGGSRAYCDDQRRIAQELFNVGQPGNLTADRCRNEGFVPLPQAICAGAQGTASCGAPASQPLSACAIDPRSWDSLVDND